MFSFQMRRACSRHLTQTFGLPSYRPGQKAAVHALVSGRDVMCVLPTGSGKSLCWQLPAVVHPGVTLVVSPLIALMRDQVQHLQAQGIPAVSLDSLMSRQEMDTALERVRGGSVRILFVSPERLTLPRFRSLCCELRPWLVVVDEAHCVVQWGESFRPAYGSIAGFIRALPRRPVLCALTATADAAMQQAISASLTMRCRKTIMLPVIRENLCYDVRTTLHRTQDVLALLTSHPCKTVIFCRSRRGAEQLSGLLGSAGVNADFYHAGLERQTRLAVQQRFQEGSIQCLCATNAFGMGVDIPDIRRVVHLELPDQLIDYVQQTGRGGRDGLPTECILYFEPDDLLRKARWRQSDQRFRRRPVSRWLHARRYWRGLQKLMNTLFSAACIPAAIAAAFGGRSGVCGKCSACRRGKALTHVPSFAGMKPWQIRAWLLIWQRDALAAAKGVSPGKILPDSALNTAARQLAFPPEVHPPEELERLIAYFRASFAYDVTENGQNTACQVRAKKSTKSAEKSS